MIQRNFRIGLVVPLTLGLHAQFAMLTRAFRISPLSICVVLPYDVWLSGCIGQVTAAAQGNSSYFSGGCEITTVVEKSISRQRSGCLKKLFIKSLACIGSMIGETCIRTSSRECL